MYPYFDILLATPEILLLIFSISILLIELFSRHKKEVLFFYISEFLLIFLIVFSILQWKNNIIGQAFSNTFIVDELSIFLKIILYISIAITIAYGRTHIQIRNISYNGELYFLILLSLLGQMVMISAGNLIIMYLSLELMSLSLYSLIVLHRNDIKSIEAAMKYFILGALASGFLLYGMSIIYGSTGHLDLTDISRFIEINSDKKINIALIFGTIFIISGLAFKLGIFPFHMWIPDVYQGSSTIITLILNSTSKFATFSITLRILVSGLHEIIINWNSMLITMSIISIALGNLAAILQTNFKRMLAYSSIAHMGFIFLGLTLTVFNQNNSNLSEIACSATILYILVYILTNLAVFGVILQLSKDGLEYQEIEDLKGLSHYRPGLAIIMLLSMLSLAGIPPLVGFYAKISIINSLIQTGYISLSILIMLLSLIGVFYYLRIIKTIYFDQPISQLGSLYFSGLVKGLLSINGLLILLISIFPALIMNTCIYIARTFLD